MSEPESLGQAELPLCSHCGFAIHPSDSRRHFGFHTAHMEHRCVELLRADIARLTEERDAARDLADKFQGALESCIKSVKRRGERVQAAEAEAERLRAALKRACEVLEDCVDGTAGTPSEQFFRDEASAGRAALAVTDAPEEP